MRIFFNQTPALKQRTGIGHYVAELLRCLRRSEGEFLLDTYPHRLDRLAMDWSHPDSFLPRLVGTPRRPGESRWSPRGVARVVQRATVVPLLQRLQDFAARRAVPSADRFDLYHEPNYLPAKSEVPTVVTVCDLSTLHHPEWHRREWVTRFEQEFEPAVRRCARILAISEFGRQEIIDTLGVAPERVGVTLMGVRPHLRPLPTDQIAAVLRRLALPQRYLLYVGTVEPRKNLLPLLRAYVGLPAAVRDRWPLLLVGGWGWNVADVADYYEREAKHRGVRHVGYVSERDLPAVYGGARALVYPSLYEGFGLPPVEMLACGGAVLASTAGAVAETVGGCAHLVEPEDEAGWHHALGRVVADDDWWQSLRRGAVGHAGRYTWERCAAETLAAYRQVLAVPQPGALRRAG